jgi:hypothetical protein
MKKLKLLFILSLVSVFAFAQSTSKSHFDQEKWVEYIEGNMPLVISVPHGGRVLSDSLAVRDCKDAITGVDGRTIELSLAIKKYFEQHYGRTPHIIISHIARKHVDQNRELNNGAVCSYTQNEKPWYSFHNYVDSAINLAKQTSKQVMYIDLHGHGHQNHRLEIGYNMSVEDLNELLKGEITLKSKAHSLTNLAKENKALDLKELTFGANAFGTYLVNNGLAATPSQQDLVPQAGEKFFSGGDNTRRYTGKNYPEVFGLQIECDPTTRALSNLNKSAKAITESIVTFLNRYAKTQLQPLK